MRPGMTLLPLLLTRSRRSPHRPRIAPGDEFRHDEAVASPAELQVGALRIGDLAAGRGDDGMSGCDIPFGSWSEAGIDIRPALPHPPHFYRPPKPFAHLSPSSPPTHL